MVFVASCLTALAFSDDTQVVVGDVRVQAMQATPWSPGGSDWIVGLRIRHSQVRRYGLPDLVQDVYLFGILCCGTLGVLIQYTE